MVLFKSMYKAFLLMVFFGFFFLVMNSVFGLNFWPDYVSSIPNLLVLYIFSLSIVLAASY